MNVFFFFCRVVIDAWVLRELTFYTPVSTPKNWNILVPHIKMTPHSETRPSRTLYPPNAQFLTDRQYIPPKLSGMPQSVSIKEAMGALGGKLVTGGVPKPGNKDDPDSDQPEKPKTRLKL